MASARERPNFELRSRWVSWRSGRLASFLLFSCLPFIQEENTVTVVPDIEEILVSSVFCSYEKNMFDIRLARSLSRSAVWEKLWTGWMLESLSLDVKLTVWVLGVQFLVRSGQMTWEQFEGQLDNPVMEALVLKMTTGTFLRPFCSTKLQTATIMTRHTSSPLIWALQKHEARSLSQRRHLHYLELPIIDDAIFRSQILFFRRKRTPKFPKLNELCKRFLHHMVLLVKLQICSKSL